MVNVESKLSVATVALLFFVADIIGQTSSADPAEVRATVERFHRALADGDRAAALQLLAPDAIILEGGEAQSRAEYEREHLGEDIAFARATKSERAETQLQQEGDAAWITTKSRTTGMFNGRKIDSVGVELMVLTKGDAGWRIRAIHWSSKKVK